MIGQGGDGAPQRKNALAREQALAARLQNDFIIGLRTFCTRIAKLSARIKSGGTTLTVSGEPPLRDRCSASMRTPPFGRPEA